MTVEAVFMEYRKYINLFIVGLALASISVFAWRQRPLTAAAQTVSPIKPLTATYSIATYGPNGLVDSETRGYALRSDAASVVLMYRPSPTDGSKLVSINVVTDLIGRRSVRVMPFITSKVTYAMTQAQVSHEKAKASARCAGEPADPVLGYAVVKAREVISSSASNQLGPEFDRIQFDRWRAPGLNCLALRTEVTLSKDNKVLQRRVETYIEIREGDPDSALFRIPDDYVERTPTDAVNEAARRFPNDPRFGGRQCNMTQLDDVYANTRKKTGAPQ